MILVLITSNNIIYKDILNNNNILIKIFKNNDFKTINLNDRMNFTNKIYNITIIEIKNEDNISNYLELDNSIKNNKTIEYKNIYIIQYPEEKLSVSYGIINNNIYNNYKFNHNCITKDESIGSPILNMNNKVVGIHINNNKGIYLIYPIK